MSVFVDTSAFLAVLDADDIEHERAKKTWEYLITNNELMICSLLNIEWIGESDHRAGVAAVLATSRRKLSLVGCVSFDVMRRLGVRDFRKIDWPERSIGLFIFSRVP